MIPLFSALLILEILPWLVGDFLCERNLMTEGGPGKVSLNVFQINLFLYWKMLSLNMFKENANAFLQNTALGVFNSLLLKHTAIMWKGTIKLYSLHAAQALLPGS